MNTVTLARNTNQALGIGQFAVDFVSGKLGSGPSAAVIDRVTLLHTDAVLCGASALALKTNAPTILHAEAHEYSDPNGATVLGSFQSVKAE